VSAVSLLPSQAVRERLDSLFYDWKTFELDLTAAERAVRRTGHLQLELGGRRFDLELQVNDLRAPGYVEIRHTPRGPVHAKPSAVATFKGTVTGDPDSVVRLLILPDLIQGYIKSGEEWLFIDPLTKYAKSQSTSHLVVFDERDVRPEAAGLCGRGELIRLASRPALDSTASGGGSIDVVTAAATRRRVDLATEADYEYYSIYGGNTNSQIQGVINQVDGIYKPELSITLRIVYQSVWTVSSDPYTSSEAESLFFQFRNYWNAYRGDVARDTAHLFTGRDLDGDTVGIAWIGALCNDPSLSYGVSQDFSLMAKLVAHEIGHNLSAQHDDQVSPPASACDFFGTIMCSVIQPFGPNSFSPRSKNDISSHVASHGSCLEEIPPTTTPSLFESYLGDGDLGQCGYGNPQFLYGTGFAEAETWTKPVRMDTDNRSGACFQQFGLYDPTGRLSGLQLKVDFQGTSNQCWYPGIRTVPISSAANFPWGVWSSAYRIDTDDRAGYCTQTFSLEGRSDVALDISFEAESNNGQCGNVGTFPVVLGRSATFYIDTDERSGGCRQKFRLRLNNNADDDGVGDRFDSCPYVWGAGPSGCAPFCGDGSCQSGETPSSCCHDCGAYCGDGMCQHDCGESAWTCPTDCGSGGSCGDGFCDVFQGECASNCPQDCTAEEYCQ
jgi:hypothetical protein